MENKKNKLSLKGGTFGISVITKFNYISSILLIILALIVLYFTPFLGNIIRQTAIDTGYGSAKMFYFLVINFEFYSYLFIGFLLLISLLLIIASIGLRKVKKWGKIFQLASWIMILVLFPIGTFYGIFALWLFQSYLNEQN